MSRRMGRYSSIAVLNARKTINWDVFPVVSDGLQPGEKQPERNDYGTDLSDGKT